MANGVWDWGIDVPENWSHLQEITTDGGGCWTQCEVDDGRVVSHSKGPRAVSRWAVISRSLTVILSHNETGTVIVGGRERVKLKRP